MPSIKTSKSGNLCFTINHLCIYGNSIVDFYSNSYQHCDRCLLNTTFIFPASKRNRKNKTKVKPHFIQITQKHEEGFSNKWQTNKGFYSHMKHNPMNNLCKSQSCVCNKLILGQSLSYARGQALLKADANILLPLCSRLLVFLWNMR